MLAGRKEVVQNSLSFRSYCFIISLDKNVGQSTQTIQIQKGWALEDHLVPKSSRQKSNMQLKIILSHSFLHSLPGDFGKSWVLSCVLVKLCAEDSSVVRYL